MSSQILAIDPGQHQSAWVLFDSAANPGNEVKMFGWQMNSSVLCRIQKYDPSPRLVIESMQNFGNVKGKSVLDTCVWIGRFIQAYCEPSKVALLTRKQVVSILCGKATAGDKDVRAALIRRFPEAVSMGFKTSHAWSALAVAAVYSDLKKSGHLV